MLKPLNKLINFKNSNFFIFLTDIIKNKYTVSTFWVLLDNLLKLFVSFLIGILIVRHLGPEKYGVYSYSLSIISFLSIISTLGIDEIIIKEFVEKNYSLRNILGTGLFLKLAGYIISLIILFCLSFTSIENEVFYFILILSFSILFKSTNVIKLFFQSTLQNKLNTYSSVISIFFSSIFKLLWIYLNLPLVYLLLIIVFESFLLFFSSLYFFKKHQKLSIQLNLKLISSTLKKAFPLLLSGISVMIYLRIDQIMLKEYLDFSSVGQYSASIRITEIFYIIPLSIVNVIYPIIIKTNKRNKSEVEKKFLKYFSIQNLIAVAIVITIIIFSDLIVNLAFGNAYKMTPKILKIHVFSILFVSLGVTSEKWYLIKNFNKYLFYRTIIGAIINIIINALFIPIYGIYGAAYSTLISQASAALFFDLTHKETRPLFILKLKSFYTWKL